MLSRKAAILYAVLPSGTSVLFPEESDARTGPAAAVNFLCMSVGSTCVQGWKEDTALSLLIC